jgi:hypothetical protein
MHSAPSSDTLRVIRGIIARPEASYATIAWNKRPAEVTDRLDAGKYIFTPVETGAGADTTTGSGCWCLTDTADAWVVWQGGSTQTLRRAHVALENGVASFNMDGDVWKCMSMLPHDKPEVAELLDAQAPMVSVTFAEPVVEIMQFGAMYYVNAWGTVLAALVPRLTLCQRVHRRVLRWVMSL